MQLHSNIVGQLTTHAQYNSLWVFQQVNIHDDLNRKTISKLCDIRNTVNTDFKSYFFKVKSIAHVVVCTNSLWVVIDHYCLASQVTQLTQAADCTPIKFHGASDAIHTRTCQTINVFVTVQKFQFNYSLPITMV